MDFNETINQIISLEWPMFHNVNGDDRDGCQENPETFAAMRRAQFSAWSEQAVGSYLNDLQTAQSEGRNLVREKYIRMMKSTDPEAYEAFKDSLPPVGEEKAALVAELWTHFLAQTERVRAKYPAIALGGRPLRASEENHQGWASIETYQTGELLTYSEDTLRALLARITSLEAQGVDMIMEIQKNSVLCMGYQTMEEAEKAIAWQIIQSMGGTQGCRGGCCCDTDPIDG